MNATCQVGRVSSLTVRMSGMNGPAHEYRHWRSITAGQRCLGFQLNTSPLTSTADSEPGGSLHRGRTALWPASHGVETVGIYTRTYQGTLVCGRQRR